MTDAAPTFPVEVVAPSTIDPAAEYQRQVYADTTHDNESGDALADETNIPTAAMVVPASRWAATLAEKLAEAVQQPFSLRTGADTDAVLDYLVRQMRAVGDMAVALNAWMAAAAERGELNPTLTKKLAFNIGGLHTQMQDAARTVNGLSIGPTFNPPPLDHETMIVQVAAELAKQGLNVTKVMVYEDQTHWQIGYLSLVLFPEQLGPTWSLIRETTETKAGWMQLAEWPLYEAFVHPAHIASLVAAVVDGDQTHAPKVYAAPAEQ